MKHSAFKQCSMFSYTCGSAREFKQSDGSYVASESMMCQVSNDNDDKDD